MGYVVIETDQGIQVSMVVPHRQSAASEPVSLAITGKKVAVAGEGQAVPTVPVKKGEEAL
jgi:hypothetical protein